MSPGGMPSSVCIVSPISFQLQVHDSLIKCREDVRFALSRPAFPCHDPLLRFLPRYSTATFAFTLLSGDKAEHESESPSETGSAAKVATLTNYLNGSDDFRDTESSSSRSSSSGFSSDYDWTFEKFEEINERRERARLERLEDQTISSHYGGSTRASEEQEAAQVPETELLAHQGTSKLCVLVVAPPNRIALALQSAVYHRRACGISQPVVGMVVSPESPIIRLAIAWPEDTSVADSNLVSSFNNRVRGLTELVHSLMCISQSRPRGHWAHVASLWSTTYATSDLRCCLRQGFCPSR